MLLYLCELMICTIKLLPFFAFSDNILSTAAWSTEIISKKYHSYTIDNFNEFFSKLLKRDLSYENKSVKIDTILR